MIVLIINGFLTGLKTNVVQQVFELTSFQEEGYQDKTPIGFLRVSYLGIFCTIW